MIQNRKSQNSIMVIVAAVIGLVIIVVIVMMLSGKLGAFSVGVEEQSNIAKKCSAQDGTPTDLTSTVTKCTEPKKEIQASDTLIDPNKICCK